MIQLEVAVKKINRGLADVSARLSDIELGGLNKLVPVTLEDFKLEMRLCRIENAYKDTLKEWALRFLCLDSQDGAAISKMQTTLRRAISSALPA